MVIRQHWTIFRTKAFWRKSPSFEVTKSLPRSFRASTCPSWISKVFSCRKSCSRDLGLKLRLWWLLPWFRLYNQKISISSKRQHRYDQCISVHHGLVAHQTLSSRRVNVSYQCNSFFSVSTDHSRCAVNPRPCTLHYLSRCRSGSKCTHGHDYALSPSQLQELRDNAKKSPCNVLMKCRHVRLELKYKLITLKL